MYTKAIKLTLISSILAASQSVYADTATYSASECSIVDNAQESSLQRDASGGITNTKSNDTVLVTCPITLDIEHDITDVNVFYQGQSANDAFTCTLNFTNLRNGYNGAYEESRADAVNTETQWFRDSLVWSNIAITSFTEINTMSAHLACTIPGVATQGSFQLTGYSVSNTK